MLLYAHCRKRVPVNNLYSFLIRSGFLFLVYSFLFAISYLFTNQICHYTRSITPKRVDNEFAVLISASLRPGNTAPFEEMPQQRRAVGTTVSELPGPRFELQTFRTRDECVIARPTGRSMFVYIISNFLR